MSATTRIRPLLAAIAMLAAAVPLAAQQRLVGGAAVRGGVVVQTWSFADAVPLDSLRVRSASQLVVPLNVDGSLGERWTASLTGAYARGAVEADVGAGAGAPRVTRRLDGLTDVRVRANGALLGDALVLSLGVNLPTGAVGLDGGQTEAVRVLGAPALDARAPVLGTGFGVTAGMVAARTLGPWAWAAGAAYERRGSYAPIDAVVAGAGTRSTELDPGDAVHLSLGGDGLVGAHRMGVNLAVDLYGQDVLDIPTGPRDVQRERYRLGPTVGLGWQWQVATPRVRDLLISVSNRYRAAFTRASGETVEGSNGNYLDLGISGLVGPPGRPSLVLGAEVRQHTGLAADRAFVGAGLTSVGATVGAVFPAARVEWRPWLRGTTGSLRTAEVSTSITGLSLGLSLNAR